jgi:hypothetical protein
LVVDPYAVLTFPVPVQSLKVIPRGHRKIVEVHGRVNLLELSKCDAMDFRGKLSAFSRLEQSLRGGVLEALDHAQRITRCINYVQTKITQRVIFVAGLATSKNCFVPTW